MLIVKRFSGKLGVLVAAVGLFGPGVSAAPISTDIPGAVAVTTKLVRYRIPPVTLTDQHGREIRMDAALAGEKPVVVQFFFTTCTTICGVRSAQILAASRELRKRGLDVGFYTISIDPHHDTPKVLLAYSRHFGVVPPPNWHLLTGTVAEVKRIQAALDASDPSADKMMHKPLTFIHAGKGLAWQRINGLTSTRSLVGMIETAVAAAR